MDKKSPISIYTIKIGGEVHQKLLENFAKRNKISKALPYFTSLFHDPCNVLMLNVQHVCAQTSQRSQKIKANKGTINK